MKGKEMAEYVTEHFTVEELSCNGSDEFNYEGAFLVALEELRVECGFPFNVTSGCRSHDYNMAIGGHPNSLHLVWNAKYGCKACAVDIVMPDSQRLATLVEYALEKGFSVGLNKHKNFVHLDMRTMFTGRQAVMWVYT